VAEPTSALLVSLTIPILPPPAPSGTDVP